MKKEMERRSAQGSLHTTGVLGYNLKSNVRGSLKKADLFEVEKAQRQRSQSNRSLELRLNLMANRSEKKPEKQQVFVMSKQSPKNMPASIALRDKNSMIKGLLKKDQRSSSKDFRGVTEKSDILTFKLKLAQTIPTKKLEMPGSRFDKCLQILGRSQKLISSHASPLHRDQRVFTPHDSINVCTFY
jgi:hypothetical protein